MFLRELEMRPHSPESVRFHLRTGGPWAEAELERELLPIVFAADPALDASDGRLLPGHRASGVTTTLFVVGPDSGGLHHLGGIACAPHQTSLIAQLAAARGFHVVGNV